MNCADNARFYAVLEKTATRMTVKSAHDSLDAASKASEPSGVLVMRNTPYSVGEVVWEKLEFKVGDKVKFWGRGLMPTYGTIITIAPKSALVMTEEAETVRVLKTKMTWD